MHVQMYVQMHVQMYVQMHLQNQVVNVEYDENLDIGIPQNQRKYSDAVHIAESKHHASDMDMDINMGLLHPYRGGEINGNYY